jgi:dihydropteroate synthase
MEYREAANTQSQHSNTPTLQLPGVPPPDAMWRVVAETGAGYVAMHMQGLPQTMQAQPTYSDVARDVEDFFSERMRRLKAVGVSADQVMFDVGIGFGKALEHNLQLLAALRSFTKLGRPLLLGVSRKSFIGALTGAGVDERLPGSLACACLAIEAGVQIIRTHDVAETIQAVRMTEAILERRK